MKMSTKGKYALEIVIDLALHSNGKRLECLKNIAERRQLSEKYLERIVKKLKENGIVRSVRGASGGYCLEKVPKDISILEILTAVEGELAPVQCLTKETDCGIDCGICPTRETWEHMWYIIKDTASNTSVADMLEKVNKLNQAK